MTGLSDYAEAKLLDHLLGTTSFTMPADIYVQLYTVAPNDAGSGGTAVGTRVVATFDSASSGTTANDITVDYTGLTPTDVIVAFGLFDASSGGNLLAVGSCSPSYTVPVSGVATFDVGNLILTLD